MRYSNGIARSCIKDIGCGRENTTHQGNRHEKRVCNVNRGLNRPLRIRLGKLC